MSDGTKREQLNMRLTPEDVRLLGKLAARLGLKVSQVVRLAIRKLADSEGMKH